MYEAQAREIGEMKRMLDVARRTSP
jgi:hypothetical protein